MIGPPEIELRARTPALTPLFKRSRRLFTAPCALFIDEEAAGVSALRSISSRSSFFTFFENAAWVPGRDIRFLRAARHH